MQIALPSLAVSLLAACASSWAASPGASSLRVAADEVRYVVDLSQPQTQTVDVTVVVPTAGVAHEELMLPVWRPGRYEILDQAATLLNVRARTADGDELPIAKTAKSTWRVTTQGADEVHVSYRIYANSLTDRTRHVDPTHAFLSGSSVFFYSPRLRSAPVRVEVRAPVGWEVATGLEPAPGETHVLVAANYDVLVDSPLEIGLHDRIEFEVHGRPHEIVVWPPGVEHDPETLIADFTAIVEEHTAIFGRTPYERYVFLVHAKRGGGGTEHLNSTIMQTSRGAVEGSVDRSSSYESFLGLVSHEFFHTWNVKQLRPAGIHPYDYQRENYTDLLWIAEGSTSYYAPLTLVRADLQEVDRYLSRLGSAADRLRRSPGARVQSVAEASWDAWIAAYDANSANTKVDYYGKGALVSLCLDLELRRRTDGRLDYDTVLRTLFERFPLSGPGYTTADVLEVLEELSGSSFEEFFARYVHGTEQLPFEQVLPAVGLQFVFEPDEGDGGEEQEEGDDAAPEPAELPLKPYLGLRLSPAGSGSRVTTLLADGPAWASGLLVGDEIVALDGKRLRPGDLEERLEDRAPGDLVTLHVLREDDLFRLTIEVAGVPDGDWKVRRVEEPTDAQKAAYASWIGHPWPGDEPEDPEAAQATEQPEAEGS